MRGVQGRQERAPDIIELHVIDGPVAGQALPKPARFQTTLTVGRTKVKMQPDPSQALRASGISTAIVAGTTASTCGEGTTIRLRPHAESATQKSEAVTLE